MTIRFTCAGCGSLLKIKDELAGTDGKCPKCKTEFVVPDPTSDDDDSAELLVAPAEPVAAPAKSERRSDKSADGPEADAAEKPVATPVAASKSKPGAKRKKDAADDEFDPAEFLQGGDDRPRRSAPALEDPFARELENTRRGSDENQQKRPAGKSPSAGTAAAAESDSGSRVSASSHAKEMMMKAMEESRAHASDAPRQEEREGFDYAGFFREFGLKIGGGVVFGILLTYGLYLVFDGMMSSKLTIPKLGYVEGTVKLDGNPLPGATVYFAPVDAVIAHGKKERARTSFGITDENGHYKMIYINNIQGVAAGKCRVWLTLVGPKGEVIPPDFTEAQLQTRDVKVGSQPPFDFDLKSK
jgi:hypothetical protein